MIGFSADTTEITTNGDTPIVDSRENTPRKSVVEIFFPERRMTLSYYNDKFDLRRGDVVYVEGKMEKLQGRVLEVHYTFKINLADYKRVIAVADTQVSGTLYFAASYLLAFDPAVLPYEKVALWFKAPALTEEEVVVGRDDTTFPLDDLSQMNISSDAAERGQEYYSEDKVRYICVKEGHGHAIVEGGECYEVEFDYAEGFISNLVCSCFCGGACKHEFAAMCELRDLLDYIEKHYGENYNDYFAGIVRNSLFSFAISGKEEGSLTL